MVNIANFSKEVATMLSTATIFIIILAQSVMAAIRKKDQKNHSRILED
ncbi:hypothetical protein [Acinetobacter ihumii]|nr:hypothetical protein [Acinetobacter ihumii]